MTQSHTRLLILLIALLTISAAFAEPADVEIAAEKPSKSKREKIPPSDGYYKGREIAVTMHFTGADWLTRESRDREEDCTTMLAALGVKPGQTVCDMGCGNGFYSIKLAEMVGKDGKVLAVDIQPQMLSLLKLRAKAA